MTDAKFLFSLGRKIKDLRAKKGFSQTLLASKCKFEKASMSRIESGKTNVTVLTLKKICSALDIKMIDLFKNQTPSLHNSKSASGFTRRSGTLD